MNNDMILIQPSQAVLQDLMTPKSLIMAFHHELHHPNDPMTNAQRDALLKLIETDDDFRTLMIITIIDPTALNADDPIDTSQGVIRNPRILARIEHGGNNFQLTLDATELTLRLLTESTNGDGVFLFEDHPSALAMIGYLYWFSGATGPANAFATMSEFAHYKIATSHHGTSAPNSKTGTTISENHNDNQNQTDAFSVSQLDGVTGEQQQHDTSEQRHDVTTNDSRRNDLLPRLTIMLIHNNVTPSHKDSIEADLSPLDGGSFLSQE